MAAIVQMNICVKFSANSILKIERARNQIVLKTSRLKSIRKEENNVLIIELSAKIKSNEVFKFL
jgi:hypothetical protein